ncbi:MAG: pantothenate kinase [Deltaproteobacteria bacterium]|nr:pantothenate kinase [Deltaproteobacteria bacterium]
MSEPVLLVIDVGNTNVSLGVFDYCDGEAGLSQHWRLSTHREQTSDEVVISINSLFASEGRKTEEITDVILSSVVPPVVPIWERVSSKIFGQLPQIVGPGMRTGMPVRYENPHEVGADRIVNAVAAFEIFGGPVIAVDFGTATTFDCISRRGEYLGGVICPGIHISMEALFERASKLHRVEIARPRAVIGRTTTGALQSGLLYGYAGMVDSMVGRIREELGSDARVVATGGLARRIASESRAIEQVAPFLTLDGLRILFEKNRS